MNARHFIRGQSHFRRTKIGTVPLLLIRRSSRPLPLVQRQDIFPPLRLELPQRHADQSLETRHGAQLLGRRRDVLAKGRTVEQVLLEGQVIGQSPGIGIEAVGGGRSASCSCRNAAASVASSCPRQVAAGRTDRPSVASRPRRWGRPPAACPPSKMPPSNITASPSLSQRGTSYCGADRRSSPGRRGTISW